MSLSSFSTDGQGEMWIPAEQITRSPGHPFYLQLNRVLRGWTTYFRPGVSFATFDYLRAFTWAQIMRRLRRKHRHINWKQLRRRYCDGGWWPRDGDVTLWNLTNAGTTRYRYRGNTIPSPWQDAA